MSQFKTDRPAVPADDQLDPEVVAFRAQFDDKSPLDVLGANFIAAFRFICGRRDNHFPVVATGVQCLSQVEPRLIPPTSNGGQR